MVADIHPGSDGSYADYFAFVNGDLFFAADDGFNGNEPWILSPPLPIPGSTHVTKRKGSPYTLVCTKTTALERQIGTYLFRRKM